MQTTLPGRATGAPIRPSAAGSAALAAGSARAAASSASPPRAKNSGSEVADQAGQVTGDPVVIKNGRAFLSGVADSQQLHDVSAVDSPPTMRARNSANRMTAPSMASIQ